MLSHLSRLFAQINKNTCFIIMLPLSFPRLSVKLFMLGRRDGKSLRLRIKDESILRAADGTEKELKL